MRVSRRRFVGGSAGCISACCLPGLAKLSLADVNPEADCALLDLGANCVLSESFWGYRTVLSAATTFPAAETQRWLERYRLVIIPGAGMIDAAITSKLAELLESGTNVLLESGAGFLDAEEFAVQQQTLRTFFQVDVSEPADLWSESRLIPYIHYDWPRKLLVRDFSRVVSVVPQRAEIIGRVGASPVAIKKRIGDGTLIFLGSPLGPSLRAGDREARAWLQSLAAAI